MARGIMGLIGLAGTLVFALPAGILGIDFLIRGRTTLGAALVVTAALMILAEEYITTPSDIPGAVAGKVLGTVAKTPEDED